MRRGCRKAQPRKFGIDEELCALDEDIAQQPPISIPVSDVSFKPHALASNKIVVCLCCFGSTPLNGTFGVDRLGCIDAEVTNGLCICTGVNSNLNCVPVDNAQDCSQLIAMSTVRGRSRVAYLVTGSARKRQNEQAGDERPGTRPRTLAEPLQRHCCYFFQRR